LYGRSTKNVQLKSLKAEAVGRLDAIAAEKVVSGHRAFSGGLEFEDFERDVAGGDEEATWSVEERPGSR